MSDDPADGSVVEVVWSLAAEENSLQDPGRKLYGILQRRVECVHHGGPAVSDLGRVLCWREEWRLWCLIILTQSVLLTFSLSLEKA